MESSTVEGAMHRHTVWYLGLPLLFSLTASVPLASKPAKTPEELIQNLVAAANRGDIDDFLSSLTENSRRVIEEQYERRSGLSKPSESLSFRSMITSGFRGEKGNSD